jgi:chromosome segregation ATPase
MTAKQNEELLAANDIPDGASTPLDNSLDGSRATLSRTGRASAMERLDTLEEENIQLLNRQAELEDELDASEEHAGELKSALKTKRENVNELHAELDLLKERMKSLEKSKAELADENEQLQQTGLLSKQKIGDLKVTSERYIEESDELEKALTTAEQRVEELEKRLDEVRADTSCYISFKKLWTNELHIYLVRELELCPEISYFDFHLKNNTMAL